jgi:glycerol-3-phosphate dehydrogenase
MDRGASLAQLRVHTEAWDIAVIGGGATGMGIAVDAASRGYATCLLEQSDFGKGTSSRSTKLIHGGVRYLRQGNIALVIEALQERGLLRQNAPHLVGELAFVVPTYRWWETPYYGLGLRLYDLLAGTYGFGKSRMLSAGEALARLPTLQQRGLRGGVLYYDGQFDDARLLLALAQTAEDHGATLLNYAPVTGLVHDRAGHVAGVTFRDLEGAQDYSLTARCVINATGPFCDVLRRQADAAARPLVAPSQGVHLVLDREFLPGDTALMVPRTSDGRVLFAIPWHGRVLVGTTETPRQDVGLEPIAFPEEIDFILSTAGGYLARRPTRADVRSVFAGIRPLVAGTGRGRSASRSREHLIEVDRSGLLTIVGGKWTTYRKMAEECVNRAALLAHLEPRPCSTRNLRIHGYHEQSATLGDLWYYGTAAEGIRQLMQAAPELARRLHPALPICAAQVVWAVRQEMARTVDDVLARRTRALQLDAAAAVAMAPQVAAVMAAELGRTLSWQQEQVAQFAALAGAYRVAVDSEPPR